MLPYIHIGKVVLESYTLFINLGTLFGAFAMYEIMSKYCRQEKYWWKLVIVMLLTMGISTPFARWIKGIFYQGNGTATHFLGRVLAALIVMEIVFRFFWKEKNCKLQARNAAVMYLAVQHLFNRISCFMNGCCGGKFIKKWNMNFPSQIAEASCMLILIILIAVYIHKEKLFYYMFFICYAICIFFSEFTIEDTRINITKISPITGVQLGACILFFLSITFCFIERRASDKEKVLQRKKP